MFRRMGSVVICWAVGSVPFPTISWTSSVRSAVAEAGLMLPVVPHSTGTVGRSNWNESSNLDSTNVLQTQPHTSTATHRVILLVVVVFVAVLVVTKGSRTILWKDRVATSYSGGEVYVVCRQWWYGMIGVSCFWASGHFFRSPRIFLYARKGVCLQPTSIS